ncbi:hypothetical protein L1987_28765 [Smallanthus sonchifolius]|uniref:Uncharacterized protein n=1 Tax=Smallanthus sonchifolius TaxID=185202 RepID=A0ACB9HZC1_9ASTR|nr:hypothetical protein L1987_28765 [Smallanthus sonchifolius]
MELIHLHWRIDTLSLNPEDALHNDSANRIKPTEEFVLQHLVLWRNQKPNQDPQFQSAHWFLLQVLVCGKVIWIPSSSKKEMDQCDF